MKRTGKFYRKNEAEVMKSLGLTPTKNSGSFWVEKEDGQSDNIICQLKSTDAQSIKINKKDLDVLNYNADVAHKIPVFAIQFLQSNEVYLILKPNKLSEVVNYLETGEKITNNILDIVDVEFSDSSSAVKKIKSSSRAREKFHEEVKRKFTKERKNAK